MKLDLRRASRVPCRWRVLSPVSVICADSWVISTLAQSSRPERFTEILGWALSTITLEDRNLPVIAERRLLKPVSAAAKSEIDQAFASMDQKMREEVHDIPADQPGGSGNVPLALSVQSGAGTGLGGLVFSLATRAYRAEGDVDAVGRAARNPGAGELHSVGDLYDVIGSEAEPFPKSCVCTLKMQGSV